jgi:acetoin utilization deacetylase AcuC-like enzyme
MKPVTVVHSERYACDIGAHVFQIGKFAGTLASLRASGHLDGARLVEPDRPTRDQLLTTHTPEYLDDLEAVRWTHRTAPSELPLSAGIVDAYVLAAGGTLRASRDALDRGVAVHVGGGYHHAYADHAEGFCYVNDLAVALRVLQHEGAIRRAAVVDLDVHQGNGTAHLFRDDPRVFTLSIHQERNYPVPKERSDLDVGLANGVGDAEYLGHLDRALEHVWAHGPEIVLYQAGADPYEHDQLGGLALTLAGLEARDRRVLEGCATRGIPVVVTFGGGYAAKPEDTIEIHARTCRVALRLGTKSPGGAERGE